MKLSNLKRMLVILIAAAGAASVTACGGQNATSPPDPVSKSGSDEGGTTAPDQGSGFTGEMEIFICNSDNTPQIAIDKLKENHPDLTVIYDQASADKYETLLKARVSAGDSPDIMTVWPGSRTADYAEKGYLQPLDDCQFISRIPETLNGEFSWENNVYAMCVEVGAEGLSINKGILDENGLEIPKDYEQFKTVCSTLLQNGIQPLASGYKEDWVIMRYTNSAFPSLGYAKDPNFDENLNTGVKDFSFEGWRETFDRFGELLDTGYFGKNLLSTDSSQAVSQFATGQTAMLIHTSQNIRVIREAAPDMDLVFTALPVNDPGDELFACNKSGVGYAVSKSSQNQQAAISFLDTWCEKEVNEQIYTEREIPSPLTDITISSVDQSLISFQEEFVHTGKFSLGAHDRWPAGMSNNWKKKLQEFVGREITTDEMIEWLNNEYKSLSQQ